MQERAAAPVAADAKRQLALARIEGRVANEGEGNGWEYGTLGGVQGKGREWKWGRGPLLV